MEQTHLFPLVREELTRILGGYIDLDVEMDSFVVSPRLGNYAGVLGALVLAGGLPGIDSHFPK